MIGNIDPFLKQHILHKTHFTYCHRYKFRFIITSHYFILITTNLTQSIPLIWGWKNHWFYLSHFNSFGIHLDAFDLNHNPLANAKIRTKNFCFELHLFRGFIVDVLVEGSAQYIDSSSKEQGCSQQSLKTPRLLLLLPYAIWSCFLWVFLCRNTEIEICLVEKL